MYMNVWKLSYKRTIFKIGNLLLFHLICACKLFPVDEIKITNKIDLFERLARIWMQIYRVWLASTWQTHACQKSPPELDIIFCLRPPARWHYFLLILAAWRWNTIVFQLFVNVIIDPICCTRFLIVHSERYKRQTYRHRRTFDSYLSMIV